MTDLSDVLDTIDRDLDRSVERLFELVRIPSISTDPAHRDDCRRAADWLVAELKGLGFDATAHRTAGHPMVVGHYTPAGAKRGMPHVLFYGHYDVQPADPLDKWTSPPFAPERRRDGKGVERLYGRGTADDKGQLMTFIEACRAWLAARGPLPCRITILCEGEEESGSPSLLPFLKAHGRELKADIAFICDTDMWDARTPAITMSLRGLLHEEVTVTGPRIDLHSGLFGGAVVNPIRALAGVLAGLHDRDGRVSVPGFYAGVREPSAATRRAWKALKFSEKKFLNAVGVGQPAGERGYSVLEQIWARPTAEINGIYGGYTGEGTKTVLPSEATAKVSFRLVGRQDPARIRASFRRWVRARLPKDCKVMFEGRGGNPAMEVDAKNPFVRKAVSALTAEFGRAPVLKGSGGSIPIVRHFREKLGLESVLVGFGLEDDAIHSPNEKYDLSSYHRGIRSWARVLATLTP
ncbi:MAG TPA: dipeptidase [Aestuariivirgaceae bacterium]|nr:dipeptidase [Aestuariivirgaceae bacterium]